MIGIGVITFNRIDMLKITLGRILQHTKGDYKLLVADDGSTDGTLNYLQENNISYVTGKNKGVCTNKSRALFHLKDCDYIYIIEDDIFPIKDGWETIYIDAIHDSG